MSQRILIVTGSPRAVSNTSILAESFRRGAESAGHTVVTFDVNTQRVDMCHACDACWSKGRACIFEDGFNQFIDELMQSDVLVFASPVYWGTFPAPLKALVDKMYAFCVPWCNKDISGKKTVLLTCGDGPDESAFELITAAFSGLTELMEWKDAKVIAVPQMSEGGEVSGTVYPDQAFELGRTM